VIGTDDDGGVDLVAWLRRYAPLVAGTVVIGLVAGIAIGILEPRPAEAWTYVIQRGAHTPSRQLAPLAEAVFTSSALYVPAMQALNDHEPPATFLRRVELRPVPGTPILIVIGRAGSPSEAQRVSSVTARALVGAFVQQGFADFALLGFGPPIVRSALSPLVSSLTGAAVGLWVGLALALAIHRFRRRSPVQEGPRPDPTAS
jgi:hypothetical protein